MKGISPIVSIVLLIAIAVVAGVGLYFWVAGIPTKQPTTEVPVSITANPIGGGKILVANLGPRVYNASEMQPTIEALRWSCEGDGEVEPNEQILCTVRGFTDEETFSIWSPDGGNIELNTGQTFEGAVQTWSVLRDGGGGGDAAYGVVESSNPGFIVTGMLYEEDDDEGNLMLWKLDSLGSTVWTQTYYYNGTNQSEGGYAVIEVSGGFAVAGAAQRDTGGGTSNYDAWVMKVDSAGSHEWNSTFDWHGEDRNNEAWSIVEASDGNYVVTGWTAVDGIITTDIWMIKVNSSDGSEIWNSSISSSGADLDRGWDVINAGDGNYIVAAGVWEGGGYDCMIMKVSDVDGSALWNETYDIGGFDYCKQVVKVSDGYALAGDAFTGGNQRGWLIKTNSSGGHVWNETYANHVALRDAVFVGLDSTSDGGYIMTGDRRTAAGDDDLWVLKTDRSGNHEWNKSYDGYGNNDLGRFVMQSTDGGFVVVGEADNGADDDLWVLKLDPDGEY